MTRYSLVGDSGFGMADEMEVSLNGEILLELPVKEVIYE